MSRKCIGIDIGGTTVKLGMFEQDGTLLEKWEIPTRKENGGAHILEDIAAAIKKKAAERGLSTADFEGAGMGLPGPVLEDGHVEFCVNLGWKRAPMMPMWLPWVSCGREAAAAIKIWS